MTEISDILRSIPEKPGIYIMKDIDGNILYIGKAKILKRRVSSYFHKTHNNERIKKMVSKIANIEVIVTNTEIEALMLESTLIKKHKPPYNVALKDDSRYVYAKIHMEDEYPWIEITRDFKRDGAPYFGPYSSSRWLEKYIDTLRKMFPVRTCNYDLRKIKRACIDYQLKRCLAPCVYEVDKEEYQNIVKQMMTFLEGRGKDLIDILEKQMVESASNLNFERAAILRDRLKAIRKSIQKQKVVSLTPDNKDIIALARTENISLVQVLFIRDGKLIGQSYFVLNQGIEEEKSEILAKFILQYYHERPNLPEKIIVQEKIKEREIYEKILSQLENKPVKIIDVPNDIDRELLAMCEMNARTNLGRILLIDKSDEIILADSVIDLQKRIGLSKPPIIIEGFDISNIQGTNPTASMVRFYNGTPDKNNYRKFKIKIKSTPDDFAMMYEVVYRRYKSVIEKGLPLPDLILIDGGKGQVNAAMKALKDLGLDYLSVIGIAKRFDHLIPAWTLEEIELPPESLGLRLLQFVRDEAHRFAVSYHRKLRQKQLEHSILDEIKGVGEKTRKRLLKKFGTIKEIGKAPVEEIASVPGVNLELAYRIKKYIEQKIDLESSKSFLER